MHLTSLSNVSVNSVVENVEESGLLDTSTLFIKGYFSELPLYISPAYKLRIENTAYLHVLPFSFFFT